MLTYRNTICHFPQLGKANCGPVALQCLFDSPVEHLEKIVSCTSKGTHHHLLLDGMKKNGIECSFVDLNDSDHSNHFWWLELVSYRWPIYLGCVFVNQGKRGRPSENHHAVLLANGFCYDGNEQREEPISSIQAKFNKKFLIKYAIIFNNELKNWKKNIEKDLQ